MAIYGKQISSQISFVGHRAAFPKQIRNPNTQTSSEKDARLAAREPGTKRLTFYFRAQSGLFP